MKIRSHRKFEWWFFPHESSTIEKKSAHIFKYKADLMKFLNRTFEGVLGGTVRLEESCFGSSGCVREYFVWFNEYKHYKHGHSAKIVLKQMDFRGHKFIRKFRKVDKSSKKYFAFSDKVISLMCRIGDSEVIGSRDANKLITLFHKRGFEDFEPNEETWEYINWHINDGIDFFHWSDRCNWVRTKAVIEYFKRENLIES